MAVVMPPIPWNPYENDFWYNEILNETQLALDRGDRVQAERLARRDGLDDLAFSDPSLPTFGAGEEDGMVYVMLGSQLGVGAYRAMVEERRDGVMVSGAFLLMGAVLIYAAANLLPAIDLLRLVVNVIGIAPNSPDALNQVLDDARSKGILVLTVNGDLVGTLGAHSDLLLKLA